MARRTSRSRAVTGFLVGPEMLVSLSYRAYDADGRRIDDGNPTLTYLHGFAQVPAKLEAVLEGAGTGSERQIVLEPEDAFGERDPARITEFERGEFPPDTAPGDCYEAETESGAAVALQVLDVDDERVVVDANHPLAGQRVRFVLEIESVRPATSEELGEAAAVRERDLPASASLISPDHLLSGGRPDYENGRLSKPSRESGTALGRGTTHRRK
ncbi:MAG TPA: hypothetical protein VF989_17190 [Polyangiaceae bacterium]